MQISIDHTDMFSLSGSVRKCPCELFRKVPKGHDEDETNLCPILLISEFFLLYWFYEILP